MRLGHAVQWLTRAKGPKVKTSSDPIMDTTLRTFGYRQGFCLALVLWISYRSFCVEVETTVWWLIDFGLERDWVGIGLLALFLWGCYELRAWFVGAPWERRARAFVEAFDDPRRECLDEVIQGDRAARGTPVPGPGGVRVRYRPRSSLKMALALADSTYFKFGYRARSEANLMITRKFMFDLMSGYPDIRDRDKASIVDMALYASFLPSQALRDSSMMDDTVEYSHRASIRPGSSWWWQRPGRSHQL